LHQVIGRRQISRFLNDLARPHLMARDLLEGYRAILDDERGGARDVRAADLFPDAGSHRAEDRRVRIVGGEDRDRRAAVRGLAGQLIDLADVIETQKSVFAPAALETVNDYNNTSKKRSRYMIRRPFDLVEPGLVVDAKQAIDIFPGKAEAPGQLGLVNPGLAHSVFSSIT
jgi:hypothetical protein